MYFLARKLYRAGVETRLFGYHAGVEHFDTVRDRLRRQILALPADVPYIAIGHSLGGLLLRAALAEIPAERQPRHLFMLATPNHPATIAQMLRKTLPYRVWNGDAGQMLADETRMHAIPLPPPGVPATVVAGTRGLPTWPFRGAPNDLIVTVAETMLEGEGIEHLTIRSAHTLIMNHPEVFRVIRDRVPDLVHA